jgi:hypothetical protein
LKRRKGSTQNDSREEKERDGTDNRYELSSSIRRLGTRTRLSQASHRCGSFSEHQSDAEQAVIEIDWRLELAKTLASQGSRQVNILSIASTWCTFRRRREGLFDDGDAGLERQVAGERMRGGRGRS